MGRTPGEGWGGLWVGKAGGRKKYITIARWPAGAARGRALTRCPCKDTPLTAHLVVRALVLSLQPRVGVEEEVEAAGRADARVDHSARQRVAGAVLAPAVRGEQARRVALLNHHKGDLRRVARL